MCRKRLAPVQHHILVIVEVDAVQAGKYQLGIQRSGGNLIICCCGVHRFRVLALQPEHHGLIGAMTSTRSTQGPEQFHLNANDVGELTVPIQTLCEPLGRPHRSHRV